jgi:2,3-bisphosphoglycerate-dependent phosphoglycerate mutase
MRKKIYVVRHCKAEGQSSDASLTKEGFKQAQDLADIFSDIQIDAVVSSPFQRAIQSVMPLSKDKEIEPKLDNRLTERILSTTNLIDWQDKLRETFLDRDLFFEGGESSKQATDRVLEVIDDILKSTDNHIIIATHGNLMSLLLKHYLPEFGYEDWEALRNPDVYLLEYEDDEVRVKHLL